MESKFKKIYVIAPGTQYTSGGPEALHQMVYYLKKCGFDASLVYVDLEKKTFSIPEKYKIYVQDFIGIENIVDDEKNAIIVSETQFQFVKKFKKSKIYIWWLSVDNNIRNRKIKDKIIYLLKYPYRHLKYKDKYEISDLKKYLYFKRYTFFNEKENIEHLCASYYAYDYVKRKTKKNVLLCIEPISKPILEYYNKNKQIKKEKINTIIYNPAKSEEYISRLAKKYSDLEFLPLKNMSINELIEWYQKSKLYIDFGPFPGAERMPKEAVLFDCAIITGKKGASSYFGDVNIYDKYKFSYSTNEMNVVYDRIKEILENYEQMINDFLEYKDKVIELEETFMKSLKDIFN